MGIAAILPSTVAIAERHDDPSDVLLFPAEEAVLHAAVEKRRREFATGRHCARLALSKLGIAPAPLLPGPKREPIWPPGITGSITHCAGYRAAAVARTTDVASLGIDAEPHGPLPPGVDRLTALPAERDHLGALTATHGGVHWDRLLFSAKESVYKAWYPLARRWLGFDEAHLVIDPDAGTFTARLLVPGPPVGGRELTTMTGRWLIRDGHVLTAVTVDAAGTGGTPHAAPVSAIDRVLP